MILSPKKESFYNDFLYMNLPDGKILRFTSLDENLLGGEIKCVIINVCEQDEDGNLINPVKCTNVIGLSDSLITISSEDESLNGKVVTIDNIDSIEISYGE